MRSWSGETGGRRRAALRLGIAVVLVAAVPACGRDSIQYARAALQAEQRVDFGAVSLARSRTRIVHIRNVGRGPVTLGTPRFEDPALPDFSFKGDEPIRLAPGERLSIETTFAPVVIGSRAVRLLIPTDSAREPALSIELWGEGILGRAELGTRRLDFGRVALQASVTLPLPLRNDTAHAAEVEVGSPVGDDRHAFDATPRPTLEVAPRASSAVSVSFSPARIGPHSATLTVRPCPSCAPEEIELVGEGIAAALIVEPSELDFDFVDPGTTVTREVTVTNVGTRTATLRSASLGQNSGAGFAAEPLPAAGIALAQDEKVAVRVNFSPANLDPQSGTLRITTDDSNSPVLVVPLRGFGGGPKLEVVPVPLSFPRTGVGMSVEKRITVRNAGHDPANQRPLVVSDLYISRGAEFRVRDSRGDLPPYTLRIGEARTLIVTYTPLSAGRSDGELVVASNDGENPAFPVPLFGTAVEFGPCVYSIIPGQLDFGSVPNGREARLAFGVRNVGSEPCIIANVRLSRSSARDFFVQPVNSAVVEPGDMLAIPVTFSPSAPGRQTGLVEFDLSSPTAPRGEVPLVGWGIDACLEIEPGMLDFGTVGLVCQPPTRSVAVRNSCNTAVDVPRSWVGTGATDAFLLSGGSGRRLNPGEQMRLDVTYQPAVEGRDFAPLYVDTSVSPAPYLVPLEGRAVARPHRTDEFEIPLDQMVDVLIVMDNSGSMTDLQDYIGSNFDRFMATALRRGIDFQIAVTTTGLWAYRGGWAECPGGVDGGEAGRFFPVDNSTPRILTPRTPNVREVFDRNVHVGICHWWEEGLEAARLALSAPLIDNADAPNHPEVADGNGGFVRPEAKLYVVYVSDEEDHGTAPVQAYVDHLRSLKPGRPDQVSASAIVGFPSCPLSPSPGYRYMEVVNALGGVVADVCDPDWGGALERIGEDAFTPTYVFPLAQEPDSRDVTVRVDGSVVEPNAPDGKPRWRFDPMQGTHGAVVFEDGSAPGPGARVEITYPVPCP